MFYRLLPFIFVRFDGTFESGKLTFVSCFSYRNWTKIKLTKCQLDFIAIGIFQMQVAKLHRIPQNISMLWLPSCFYRSKLGEISCFRTNAKCGFSQPQHCEVLRICDSENESPERNYLWLIYISLNLIHYNFKANTINTIEYVLHDIITTVYVVWALDKLIKPRKIKNNNNIFQ